MRSIRNMRGSALSTSRASTYQTGDCTRSPCGSTRRLDLRASLSVYWKPSPSPLENASSNRRRSSGGVTPAPAHTGALAGTPTMTRPAKRAKGPRFRRRQAAEQLGHRRGGGVAPREIARGLREPGAEPNGDDLGEREVHRRDPAVAFQPYAPTRARLTGDRQAALAQRREVA